MIYEGPRSIICPDVNFTEDMVRKLIGKSVTSYGITIGTIRSLDFTEETVRIDIAIDALEKMPD